jgi:hypothetical protein
MRVVRTVLAAFGFAAIFVGVSAMSALVMSALRAQF